MPGFLKPERVIIDFKKGAIQQHTRKKEVRLSEMKEYFSNIEEAEKILSKGKDPVIYEYYEYVHPEVSGNLNFGLSIVYPGKIGKEYYMTRGHFHLKDSSELYLCLKGRGMILMQNKDGEFLATELEPGSLGYVPPGWGHRTINTGGGRFIFFFAYPADAGHDYIIIREKGFTKIVIEEDEAPKIIDNPRYHKT